MTEQQTSETRKTGGANQVPPQASTLGTAVRAWWANLHDLSRDYILLATLELQRAGVGLALILAAGLVVAVLIVTAWTALVAGAIVWWVQSGASWPAALVCAAAFNLLIAALMLMQMRQRFTDIFLGATLRQLRGESSPQRES